MARYESTNTILGQFLPKIYTRRITISDNGNYQQKSNKTSLSVDFQIKDLLDETGVGIITQNTTNGVNTTQDEVLSALKIVVAVFGDADTARLFLSDILSLSQVGTGFYNGVAGMHEALRIMHYKFLFDNKKMHYTEMLARPEEMGFELRNPIYQQYDANNNVVNIIPYTRTFELNNDEWDECNNLSVVCFSYFDFDSLNLEGLSDSEAKKLSYTISAPTYDVVTSNGKVTSLATVYKDLETGAPYYGPVHYHPEDAPAPDGYVGYMAGFGGADMGPRLRSVTVPVTKIQDFRSFQRTQLVNYQPPQLEYYNNTTPDLSFFAKRNRNYFGLTGVIVDYDYEEKHTNINFTVNFSDIFKNNSVYYDLVSSIGSYWNQDTDQSTGVLPINTLLSVSSVKILRRRMTKRPVTTDRLGNPKRKEYMIYSEPEHIVVQMPGTVTSAGDESGFIRLEEVALRTRSYYVNDMEISKYHNSAAVFQYGVEISIIDTTRDYFEGVISRARRVLEDLKMYAEESKIPVFNSYYIKTPEENLPIGLSEGPSYADDITEVGNYDVKTNTFTRGFKESARSRYGNTFDECIIAFRQLVYLSTGKSQIKQISRGSNIIQSESENMIFRPNLASESNASLADMESDATEQSLRNMIDPINARPETIDSFIRSFESLVLEMEKYFGFSYASEGTSTAGAGYTSKSNKSFTVQRWFNSQDANIDISSFVDLSPATSNIYFDYGLEAQASDMTVRTVPETDLTSRLLEEQQNFAIPDGALASVAPRSLTIGSVRLHFDQQQAELARQRDEQRTKYARARAHLFLDPANQPHVAAVNTFVTRMQEMERDGQEHTVEGYVQAVNTSAGNNFFTNLMAINNEIVDNSVLYGDESVRPTLVSPPIEKDFAPTADDCKIINNTFPSLFELEDLTVDFSVKQDILNYGYDQRFGRLQALGTPFPEVQDVAPQVLSGDFPSGGIFDRAIRVLSVENLPLTMDQVQNFSLFDGNKVALLTVDKVTQNALSTNLQARPGNPTTENVSTSFTTFEVNKTSASPASPETTVGTPSSPSPTPSPTPTPTARPTPTSTPTSPRVTTNATRPAVISTPRVSSTFTGGY